MTSFLIAKQVEKKHEAFDVKLLNNQLIICNLKKLIKKQFIQR